MHLFLTDRGSEPFLLQELRRAFPSAKHEVRVPGLIATDLVLQGEAPPRMVFARQFLPNAEAEHLASIKAWAQRLFDFASALPADQPWQAHILPQYGSGMAGQNRCALIARTLEELLQRKRRHLLLALQRAPVPFAVDHSFLQLLLLAPDEGFISLATAPLPSQIRGVLWPFPKGEIPIASDKAAPSRAFAKLLEAEQRLGCRIAAGETCVDLGAAPGSWSYVALQRGARVLAVDRAPLRSDLMSHPRLIFQQGNAFTFNPPQPVDWLLCDIIAAPARTIELLLAWVRRKQSRRFIVTIKFKGTEDYGLLEGLKHALPPLCSDLFLTHLSANKNEVCAFGCVREIGARPAIS